MVYPKDFSDLLESFKLLPGVGDKSAERYVYCVDEMTDEEAEKCIKDAFDGTFIGVKAEYEGGMSEEAYYYIEYDFTSVRAGIVFSEYLLYRLT